VETVLRNPQSMEIIPGNHLATVVWKLPRAALNQWKSFLGTILQQSCGNCPAQSSITGNHSWEPSYNSRVETVPRSPQSIEIIPGNHLRAVVWKLSCANLNQWNSFLGLTCAVRQQLSFQRGVQTNITPEGMKTKSCVFFFLRGPSITFDRIIFLLTAQLSWTTKPKHISCAVMVKA